MIKTDDYYVYHYNNVGNVAKIESIKDLYQYYYDSASRLTGYQFNDYSMNYRYGTTGNILDKYYELDEAHHLHYDYNADNAVTKITFCNDNDSSAMTRAVGGGYNMPYTGEVNYIYDALGRMKEQNINDVYKTNYYYVTKGYRTSFLLDKMKNGEEELCYKYDTLNNITDIYKNNMLQNHYVYNNLSWLLEDYDYNRNKKTIYTYDTVGNILSKKEYQLDTDNLQNESIYEYNNNDWQDQLTKFNSEDITYDAVGNPLRFGNKEFTWENGRQLSNYKDESQEIKYEYNKDYIRTKKIVNGVTTTYYVENNYIIFEKCGNNVLYYIRDGNGNLIGIRDNGHDTYYYIKNASNDIIGLLNSNYEKIASYHYDALGKIISIKDQNGIEITDQNHIAHKNPFRYRSYYYDRETDLYYLNLRYYNPEWGRFLNTDEILGEVEELNYNLYWYANNNFVNNADMDGNIAGSALALGGAAALIGGAALAYGFYQLAVETTKYVANTIVDLAQDFQEFVNRERNKRPATNHSVYVLEDPDTKKVEHVGRTINTKKRSEAHKANRYRKHLVMKVRDNNLTYTEARGKEEELILKYKTLNRANKMNNQIHGISPNHKYYNELIELGRRCSLKDSETYVGG